MTDIKYFFCNPYYERCFVVWGEDKGCVIIDPGFFDDDEAGELFDFISDNSLKPLAILLTHAHFDHIYSVRRCIDRYAISVYMHPDDKVVLEGDALFATESGMPAPVVDWPTIDISEGEILKFACLEFKVMETPGHSPGSVCFFCADGNHLFSGDTLFAGSIGKTSHRWGDYDKEIVSLMDKLMVMDGDVKVHPGHGGGTTIGYERIHNPFLEPFNAKDPESGMVEGIEMR